MIPLYHREAVYRLDRQAMTLDAQPPCQLMARAARAAWNALTERWPEAHDLLILTGPGNNGGDAFALGTLALRARLNPRLIQLGGLDRQSSEAAACREDYLRHGGVMEAWQGELPVADVIVDGLLGIGLNKPLRDDWLRFIEAVNAHPAPVLSIDIPSGLHAETGRPLPEAVRAALTVTFIARKAGLYLADGPDCCGELLFDDLGLSRAARASESPALNLLQSADLHRPEPRRRNSHKYDYGSVLVIGGDRTLAGAALLAGQAALKAGVGLVRLCVHPDAVGSQLARAPELMCCGWDELEHHLPRASHLIVGPGLGRGNQAQALLHRLQDVDTPMLIDADALQPEYVAGLSGRPLLLTPHAGEAARMLGSDSDAVQDDRLAAVHALVDRYRATVLLKGQDSLIGQPQATPLLMAEGMPGMATAGMGDLLSGLTAGLWAQGMDPLDAAATAAFWQARAARHAARHQTQLSLTVTGVLEALGPAAGALGIDGDD